MLKFAVNVSLIILVGAVTVLSVGGTGAEEAGVVNPDIATRHLRVSDPASLNGKRAENVYQAIREAMRLNYARSSDPVTLAYQNWRRFTAYPYRSAVHGERFVNNYANDTAERYGLFEKAGQMPVGALVAKDSFTVTESGNVMTGPLFLMEKKSKGFDSYTGDWLFLMIRPDGTLVGDTWNRNTESVAFCAKCHNTAPPEQDHLFFMPKDVRVLTGGNR